MSYAFKTRPEVANLIPPSARVIVDVGCGEGDLGQALKASRPAVWVGGLEVHEPYAKVAATKLDAVSQQPAEAGLPAQWQAPDCLIFADSLEHMVDPWSVLNTLARSLKPGGCVVISLPNVVHFSVQDGLARGEFEYTEWGILDRTHLRFFTRHSLLELVESSGLSVEHLERVMGYPGGFPRQSWSKLRAFPARIAERSSGPPRSGPSTLDRYTYQYLVRAR